MDDDIPQVEKNPIALLAPFFTQAFESNLRRGLRQLLSECVDMSV